MKEIPKVDLYILKKEKDGANFNMVFGVIFLAWCAYDIVNDPEELFMFNIFSGLLGLAFVWFGFKGLRDVRRLEAELRSNDAPAQPSAETTPSSSPALPVNISEPSP